MLPLTKQERFVIAFVSLILMAGIMLRFLIVRSQFINNFINQIAQEKFHPHIDINRADKDELVDLPYIGEKTASAIIAHREKNGAFKSVEEVARVNGLSVGTFQKIKKYLIVRN